MKQKGFSLVELIIVVAIFMVITTVVVFNQNRFSSDISISNIAYQVALQIRQAQVYGTLVRESEGGLVEDGAPSDFDLAYGVSFFKNANTDNTIGFRIFADSDYNENGIFGNGYYESSVDGSPISTFNLSEGNTITELCVYSGNSASCMNSEDESSQVDIVFRRPEPDAIISSESITNADRAEITITSALRDKQKRITVRNTGQISVESVVQ